MTQTTFPCQAAPERYFVYHGLTWQQFESIRAGFSECPGVRLCFYKNTLEIFMPGREHEVFKSIIRILLETFCLDREIEIQPTSATTWEAEGTASLQADESYCFGGPKPMPDLAIEVTFSSGGVNKLQKYQAIAVPEVWFWEDGVLSLYCLREEGYERVDRSEIPALADLDMEWFGRCVLMAETSWLEAVKAFRQGSERR